MKIIKRTCLECGGSMTAELLRPDPHQPPEFLLICPCGHSEPASPDIEAELEDRPRMPGF